jgi:hypothetical protein
MRYPWKINWYGFTGEKVLRCESMNRLMRCHQMLCSVFVLQLSGIVPVLSFGLYIPHGLGIHLLQPSRRAVSLANVIVCARRDGALCLDKARRRDTKSCQPSAWGTAAWRRWDKHLHGVKENTQHVLALGTRHHCKTPSLVSANLPFPESVLIVNICRYVPYQAKKEAHSLSALHRNWHFHGPMGSQ